jgi:hypothetical protein
MKGKIDNNGWLRIERGGKEKLQECPFTQKTFQVNDLTIREPCGDWCPLFDEPEKRPKCTYLILCHRMIEFAEFTDERGKE